MADPLIFLRFFSGAVTVGGREELGLVLVSTTCRGYGGFLIHASLRSMEGMLAFPMTLHEAFERNSFESSCAWCFWCAHVRCWKALGLGMLVASFQPV